MDPGKPSEFARPVAQVLTGAETNFAIDCQIPNRTTPTSVTPPPPEQKWVGATLHPRFSNSTWKLPDPVVGMCSNSEHDSAPLVNMRQT